MSFATKVALRKVEAAKSLRGMSVGMSKVTLDLGVVERLLLENKLLLAGLASALDLTDSAGFLKYYEGDQEDAERVIDACLMLLETLGDSENDKE